MAKQIFEGKQLVVLERDDWEYVERKKATEAVAVIAMTKDDEVILTEQQRKPVNARVIDWPAGLVGDDGENDPAATAKKELEEETGFVCERVELLARGPSSPGITSEIVSLYRAYDVKRVGKGGGVGDEQITVHLVPLGNVERWLR
ncbi:MAG TPA: NUDIX hydrolase, partial [Thermoanaerobaculia bacterium]